MRNKAIITSALPYANGEIHLGHIASTYLPADITARFLRAIGVEAYHICATDDFGTPILVQSEKEGISPRQYVEKWNGRDLADFNSVGIEFDAFGSTSCKNHENFTQSVFLKLQSAGHIYEKNITQYYCSHDEKFLPDRYIKGTCPNCNAADQYSDSCDQCGKIPDNILNPKCALCGNTPVLKSSLHWFFRLSAFQDKILHWLKNSNLQAHPKNYAISLVEKELLDWDITRDIPWGVQIPLENAENKVLYGWFDNHLAYISTALKFLTDYGIEGREFWNDADLYHFIGKDIIFHHYVYLAAIRLALNHEFKLPTYIPTRGHLKTNGEKLSKSRGNSIKLRDFLKNYPSDYLRFYLSLSTPASLDDVNFDWDDFTQKINTELIGNIGNFANRALGFTLKKYDGVVPDGEFSDIDIEANKKINDLPAEITKLLQDNNIDKAIKKLLEFSSYFNAYFQQKEPWKTDAPECQIISLRAVAVLALLLYPIIPSHARILWTQLGFSDIDDVLWNNIPVIKPGHKISSDIYPVFEKLETLAN